MKDFNEIEDSVTNIDDMIMSEKWNLYKGGIMVDDDDEHNDHGEAKSYEEREKTLVSTIEFMSVFVRPRCQFEPH